MAPVFAGLGRPAAVAAAILLGGLIVFQLLLAAGVPLGRFAWGGEHAGALPPKLRWASLAAVPILVLAAWSVLARAGCIAPAAGAKVTRIAVWFFAGYFTINTVLNLLSASPPERLLMTPVSALLAGCCFIVARS